MYAERCSATATETDCESLWNINVQLLYGQLVAGTLGIDELRFACRCVFLLNRRLFTPPPGKDKIADKHSILFPSPNSTK